MAIERSKYIAVAPLYYALAIASKLKGTLWGAPVSEEAILAEFTTDEESRGEPYCLLGRRIIFDKAIKWLLERDAIEIIADDFGPPIYKIRQEWDAVVEIEKGNTESPLL